MLNRYCNMRITDETLYYADKLKGTYEFGNPMMRDFFFDRFRIKSFNCLAVVII